MKSLIKSMTIKNLDERDYYILVGFISTHRSIYNANIKGSYLVDDIWHAMLKKKPKFSITITYPSVLEGHLMRKLKELLPDREF